MELADTSAWVHSRRPGQEEFRAWFDGAVERGEIATCDMVRLELLYTARSASEFRRWRLALLALPDCPAGKPVWERALAVYERLAERGGMHQRQVGHADLLIAAAAEGRGIGVLHVDRDFDRIAAVTDQPVRRAPLTAHGGG